jgi:hypothetical protein
VKVFNLKKLNYVQVTSNRSGASENLCDSEDLNGAWKRENNKISIKESLTHYRLKQHKQWFYEECSEFVDERKQAKMEWLQGHTKLMQIIRKM